MSAIWVLTGSKTGDNAQVLRAAHAMGLPFEVKRLAVKPVFETAKPKVEPSLDIFDLAASDRLEAPWPDLVITVGRRLSLAALWIKRQSGGAIKIALFNAPKGQSDAFDLIVVPSYYRIAEAPRVCRIGLPLIAVDPAKLTEARDSFAARLGAMPKPLNVLLLGGDMGQRKLAPGFTAQIVRQMQQSHARDGSIFVSTSRRTSAAATDAAEAELRPSDRMFRWTPEATDNPYLGLLAHGDSFTVTADSISMLTEVARLGRPLFIAEPYSPKGVLEKLWQQIGLPKPRDIEAFSASLIHEGYAVKLGNPLQVPHHLPPDSTTVVGQRLRELVTSPLPERRPENP